MSEVENMRKNHLMLKTVLNQAISIKMYEDLETSEKAAKIAEEQCLKWWPEDEHIEAKAEGACPFCTIAQKIREDLGLPSHNLPSLWEIVND